MKVTDYNIKLYRHNCIIQITLVELKTHYKVQKKEKRKRNPAKKEVGRTEHGTK